MSIAKSGAKLHELFIVCNYSVSLGIFVLAGILTKNNYKWVTNRMRLAARDLSNKPGNALPCPV
jgi:hypothetical protein